MAVIDVDSPGAFERDVLHAEGPTVVLFWASWCPFCQVFRPAFERSAAKATARFAIVWLDDDSNPLWDTYDVRVVPTLALFRDGDVAARLDGRRMIGLSEAQLASFLGDVLPAAKAA